MNPPLPLEVAQARLLEQIRPLPLERIDVPSALGRYLASPLHARRTQPAAHVSAMDGYAVRIADLRGPWNLAGESAAGHPYLGTLQPGEAVRISTGALLPEGAGAVIVQEDVVADGSTITLSGNGPVPPEKHIRHKGMDFECEVELLPAGTRIGPAQIALALAAGHRHLPVRRRPRIAIIDSGDELAADPEHCPLHQIPASNGAMLAALCTALPVDIHRIGPIGDQLDALESALDAAKDADVIVTTGGASVGDHDLVRPALQAWGATLDFWRVAIRPGKPLLVARRGQQLVIGLPGNPASSLVTAYLFLLPVLRALLGAAAPLPQSLELRLTGTLPASGDRREFVRASLRPEGLSPVSNQDSGALAALARTDMLIERAPHSPPVASGALVRAYPLQNGGFA